MYESNYFLTIQFVYDVFAQQSPNLEEKLCALQTIGTYLESEEYVKLIVENDIVKVMLTLLMDDSSQVRNATAGTLRNFSTLSLDACEYLIEQDVLTLLVTFFNKVQNFYTCSSYSKQHNLYVP